MGVYIKGMEIPESCFCGCPLSGSTCRLWQFMGAEGTKMRHKDCPLVEVPDHGDLIDRDVLMKHKASTYDIDGHEIYAVGTGTILRMPVVIPAERSEA